MARRGWALAVAVVAAVSGCDGGQVKPALGTLDVKAVPDFGHVMLGRQASYRLEITNVGRRPVTLESIEQDGPVLKDFVVDPGDMRTLGSSQRTFASLQFVPSTLGQRVARLAIRSDATVKHIMLDLSGTGILGKADYAPKALDFGKVGLSSSSTLPVTFTNTSAEDPAEIEVGVPSDPDAFRVKPSGKQTLQPGVALPIEVRFHPWRLGTFNATLPVRPCPSCQWETVTLTGEGIAASLTAEPSPLDFGAMAPGQQVVKAVTVTNLGTRPVKLSAATFGGQSSNAFSFVAPFLTGTVLQQNQSVAVNIGFMPTDMGAKTGELRVPTDDDGTPIVIVPVMGSGAGPAIAVVPDAVAFPRTAVGLTVQKDIDIRNVGLDPNGTNPLIVTNMTITNGASFGFIGPTLPMTLPVGRGQYVHITYSPTMEESIDGQLVIESNDPLRPHVTVPLHGSSSKLGDCTYAVVPPALDFASVAVGQHTQLSFAIRNTGANDCSVANIRLSATSAPEFAVTNISTRIITPGQQLLIPVEFSPDGPGPFTGAVDFDVNSMAAPEGEVPLSGGGVPACFAVVPQSLDFGTVGLMCHPPTLQVALHNNCQVPVNVNRSYIGPSPSDAFNIDPANAGAQTLNPGAQSTVAVTYAPKVEAMDSAPLYVDTSLQANPYLVALSGNAVDRLTQTDTFQIPPIQKVDILWMIDNSGSMTEKQQNLANNAARFIQHAVSSGVDYHIAVTTSGLFGYTAGYTQCPGGAYGGEDGRFFPVDNSVPRILTNQTPNVVQDFATMAHVGTCHWIESGMEGVRRALSAPLINELDDPTTPQPNDGNAGFLRPDARLAVIYVSDQNDVVLDTQTNQQVPNPEPVQTYINQLLSLKPGRPDLVTATAVIGLPSSCNGNVEAIGTRYVQLAQALGGNVADICGDWAGIVDAVATNAFQPQFAFPLTQAPDDRNFTVSINGVPIPETASDGTQNWRYDATMGQYGEIVFSQNAAPGPNSTVTITYDLPCPMP